MAKTWSEQQNAIFGWFSDGEGHLIVRARAGTGKTTTIIEGVGRAPETSILLAAFNKKIADELTTRIQNPNATCKTLHSVGFALVRRAWEGVKVEGDRGARAKALTDAVCGGRTPDAIRRLVTRLHTLGREIAPHAQFEGDLTDLQVQFDCQIDDEEWGGTEWDNGYVEQKALEAMRLAANQKPAEGIDFADMIFLPVRNRWMVKTYDLVVVDEAQDMTVAQLEIAKGVCRGRICVVGDDRQAIYGFRGADSGSLDRLKAELQAAELGLTTTYRCGQAIVALAAELVPDFEAGPQNPAGTVRSIPEAKLVDEVGLGDFLLSRTNAPLVATAMSLLRAGKRTKVAGKDIGRGLQTLVRQLTKRSSGVPAFLEYLNTWEAREIRRARAKARTEEAAEKKIEEITDRADVLRNLADGARGPREIEDRIDALFTDDGLGQAGVITCSSVHRAKGLEANRVFILAETMKGRPGLPVTTEELNIRYVAITRAKAELVMAIGG